MADKFFAAGIISTSSKPKIDFMDGSLLGNHKAWLVKVGRESQPAMKAYYILAVGKTGMYLHDPVSQLQEYSFPYIQITGFETNTAYQAFIWNFRPTDANAEGWHGTSKVLQSVLDIQTDVNSKIQRLLVKDLGGDKEEAEKIMDECKLKDIVSEKRAKDAIEVVTDTVPARVVTPAKQGLKSETPARNSKGPSNREETPSKLGKGSNSGNAETPSRLTKNSNSGLKRTGTDPGISTSSKDGGGSSSPKSSSKASSPKSSKKGSKKTDLDIVELDDDL